MTVGVLATGVFASIAAALAIAFFTRGATVTEASAAGKAADALAASIGNRNAPQPLLDAFTAAGQIRAATIYGHDGRAIAASGSPSGGELVCRSMPGGNTLCVEPAVIATSTPGDALIRGAVAAVAIAIIVAGLLALALVATIRERLRALRGRMQTAAGDETLSTRLPIPRGELGPLSQSLNELLEEMQTREVTLRRRTKRSSRISVESWAPKRASACIGFTTAASRCRD